MNAVHQLATHQRLAQPAPASTPTVSVPHSTEDQRLHALCEEWAYWARTRRFFAPAPQQPNILGKLSGKARALPTGAPDAPCSARLQALNTAIERQPKTHDRLVFELYYYHRVRNIKVFADKLGMSRQHFYRQLADFRSRVVRTMHDVLAQQAVMRFTVKHLKWHQKG